MAAQLNIEAGQQIIAINNEPVLHWQDVNHAIVGLIGHDNANVTFGTPHTNVTKTINIDLTNWQFDPQKQSSLASFGLVPFRPLPTLEIAQISKSSPASDAGLKKGDVLIAANQQEIKQWSSFATLIQQSYGTSIELIYQRNAKQMTTTLFPELKISKDGIKQGFAGIATSSTPWPEENIVSMQYGVLEAFFAGANKTWDITTLSFSMIKKLLIGDLSVKNLSGPISIAQGAGQSASYGFVAFLSFLALISINLGIFNLLPLPVLDGGHLMYYFIELLTGKPVPEKIQDVGFRIGAALLFMLMSIAIFNDFTRL